MKKQSLISSLLSQLELIEENQLGQLQGGFIAVGEALGDNIFSTINNCKGGNCQTDNCLGGNCVPGCGKKD